MVRLNSQIQSPNVEILKPQTDRRVALERAVGPPIDEPTEEISQLTEREEQTVAEVRRQGGDVGDRDHGGGDDRI